MGTIFQPGWTLGTLWKWTFQTKHEPEEQIRMDEVIIIPSSCTVYTITCLVWLCACLFSSPEGTSSPTADRNIQQSGGERESEIVHTARVWTLAAGHSFLRLAFLEAKNTCKTHFLAFISCNSLLAPETLARLVLCLAKIPTYIRRNLRLTNSFSCPVKFLIFSLHEITPESLSMNELPLRTEKKEAKLLTEVRSTLHVKWIISRFLIVKCGTNL